MLNIPEKRKSLINLKLKLLFLRKIRKIMTRKMKQIGIQMKISVRIERVKMAKLTKMLKVWRIKFDNWRNNIKKWNRNTALKSNNCKIKIISFNRNWTLRKIIIKKIKNKITRFSCTIKWTYWRRSAIMSFLMRLIKNLKLNLKVI